ncbi:hypothetical protein A464_1739 [Salmonella bongori N268-08]|uniref:Uncharacterized protein n=1 Tax=Salmonella bongori N268-08 TaxID=1197719 RepID=S5MWE9_SALBN|nr:hypothetical protein A464_1739 [Salmonella bongori N268-08]
MKISPLWLKKISIDIFPFFNGNFISYADFILHLRQPLM